MAKSHNGKKLTNKSQSLASFLGTTNIQKSRPISISKTEKPTSYTHQIVTFCHLLNQNSQKRRLVKNLWIKNPQQYKTKAPIDPNEDNEKFPKKINMKVSNRISNARRAKNWTQKDLALKANVTHNMVTQYENGSAIPQGPVLVRLGEALGINLRKPE